MKGKKHRKREGRGAWEEEGNQNRERDREHYHLGRPSGVRKKKKTKEWEREKKVHGQIHLPLLQSISGQKKYTITRQEEAKINGPPTSPLTSIHLHPIPPLSLFLPPSVSFFSLSPSPHSSFSPHSFALPIPKKPLSFFSSFLLPSSSHPPRHTHTHTLSLPHAVIYSFC